VRLPPWWPAALVVALVVAAALAPAVLALVSWPP
jgi:hypothetical protein